MTGIFPCPCIVLPCAANCTSRITAGEILRRLTVGSSGHVAWLNAKRRRGRGPLGLRLNDLACGTLVAVHEAASSLASTVNNCGVADQIEWLIGRCGLGAVEDMIDTLASNRSQDSPSRKEAADEHPN